MNKLSANMDDDMISYCGSIAGETFSSARRRNTCTLRQHSVANMSRHIKGLDTESEKNSVACASIVDAKISPHHQRSRFNKSFHYYRFIVAILGGLSVGLMFLLRYNVTLATLKMVNQTALYMVENPNATSEEVSALGLSSEGEFVWNNEIQQLIMSLYMIAYTIPQMPSTRLAMSIGSRWSTPIFMSLCVISSLLTPTVAFWGWKWVVALRLLNGLGAASVIPMSLGLVEKWMPFDKISLGLSITQLTQALVQTFIPIFVGYLSDMDWRYAFYVPGLVTFVFTIVWVILVTDQPDENWLISERELEVICGCSNGKDSHKFDTSNGTKSQGDEKATNNPGVMDILKIPSFYAYVFIWCFYCSSFSAFAYTLPTYLSQFLKVPITEIGFFCSIIMSGALISMIWPHPLLRFFQSTCKLSPTASNRVGYAIVCTMGASTWGFLAAFHKELILTLFVNRAFHAAHDIIVVGSLMSNYAHVGSTSLVFSMMNTVGNLSVVLVSPTIGWLLDYTGQSPTGWSLIYLWLVTAQLITVLTFSTVINARPVQFNKDKDNEVSSFQFDIEANSGSKLGDIAIKNSMQKAHPGIRDIRSVSCYSQQSR